jgi:hypothetical protein
MTSKTILRRSRESLRTSKGNPFMNHFELWLKGMLAAAIAGAANGIITGFAAVGIDPTHFNLQAGFANTLAIASVSAGMSGIIAVAAYLKQSPLPDDSAPAINTDPYPSVPRRDEKRDDNDRHDAADRHDNADRHDPRA